LLIGRSFTQPRGRHETYQDAKISYLAKGKSGDKGKGRGGKPNYKGYHKGDRDRVKGRSGREEGRQEERSEVGEEQYDSPGAIEGM